MQPLKKAIQRKNKMKITTIDGNGNFVRLTYKVETLKPKPAKYFLFFNLETEEVTEEVRIMPNGTIQKITVETIRPEKSAASIADRIIDTAFAACASIVDNTDELYSGVIDTQVQALNRNRRDIRLIVEHMLSIFKTESIDDKTEEFFGLDTDTVEIPEIVFPEDDTDD
jgi:uncharacterized protein involved in tolerance to divalent cations